MRTREDLKRMVCEQKVATLIKQAQEILMTADLIGELSGVGVKFSTGPDLDDLSLSEISCMLTVLVNKAHIVYTQAIQAMREVRSEIGGATIDDIVRSAGKAEQA